MNGQRDHRVGQLVGDRATVVVEVQIAERRLPVHRDGIIDGRGDVQGLQGSLQARPLLLVLQLKRVLRPTGIEAFGNDGCLHHTF